jgi:hypothetical protein
MQEKKNLRGSDKYCAAGGGGCFFLLLFSIYIFNIHLIFTRNLVRFPALMENIERVIAVI